MSKTIRINVTQRDIERGSRRTSDACPIALAARRHREARGCTVGSCWVWSDGSGRTGITLPEEARNFVAAFDFGRPVVPFSFELELPEEQG